MLATVVQAPRSARPLRRDSLTDGGYQAYAESN